MTAHRPASPSSSPSSATWCPPCRRLKPSPELGWTLLEGNQWQPAPPPSSACWRMRSFCWHFAVVAVAAVVFYCPPVSAVFDQWHSSDIRITEDVGEYKAIPAVKWAEIEAAAQLKVSCYEYSLTKPAVFVQKSCILSASSGHLENEDILRVKNDPDTTGPRAVYLSTGSYGAWHIFRQKIAFSYSVNHGFLPLSFPYLESATQTDQSRDIEKFFRVLEVIGCGTADRRLSGWHSSEVWRTQFLGGSAVVFDSTKEFVMHTHTISVENRTYTITTVNGSFSASPPEKEVETVLQRIWRTKDWIDFKAISFHAEKSLDGKTEELVGFQFVEKANPMYVV
eukprot:GHVS01072623.1.p1 GENE.GHVS01072623.1~~GHVS01072623.1.p1  ORF type:complete len:338 (-),score=19.94 GHVS01072623.1:342-1355(-)